MKKSIYIISAVLIAAGLTIVQILAAGAVTRKNEMEVCRAVRGIKAGNTFYEEDIETIRIYKGEFSDTLLAMDVSGFIGKTASRDIEPGSLLCSGDIDNEAPLIEDAGFVALEVSGDNFNAGNLEKGDFIDLYMLPDLSEVDNGDLMWLNGVFAGMNVDYVPGKQPGVLIEGLLIDHIDTATGNTAKYVSVRIPSPLDEAVVFLEQISVYEFIGR